jgi:hypothetical protein
VDSRLTNDQGITPTANNAEPTALPLSRLGHKRGGLSPVVLALIVLGVVGVVSVGALVAVFGFGAFLLKGQADQTKHDAAKAQVKVIEAAADRYHLANDEYPSTISGLTQSDAANDGQPYLSTNQIIDPWGKKFQFDPEGPHHQGDKPDIYTVSPDGTMIGNW